MPKWVTIGLMGEGLVGLQDFLQGLVVCGDLPQESRHALPTYPAAAGELS